jgi:hypothetical protein
MRKCDGVSGCKSLGSVDSGVKGRELRIDSIWLRHVFISSQVKSADPKILIKWNFVDFTAASQRPPKFGALGGIKFH